jgi:hypothetical protein
MAVAVSPTGSVSTTVTTPAVDAPPIFVTVKTYDAPLCPCVNDPLWVFATMRSTADRIVVESAAVSLAAFASPPPATTAVLVTLADASTATDTVNVIGG